MTLVVILRTFFATHSIHRSSSASLDMTSHGKLHILSLLMIFSDT